MLRSERGQSLVELALVLPLLILLLAGMADLGRAFFSYIEITNAAQEGTRAGSRLPCYPGDAAQRQAMKTSITNAAVAEAANSGVTLAADNITIIPDPVSDWLPDRAWTAACQGEAAVQQYLERDYWMGDDRTSRTGQ